MSRNSKRQRAANRKGMAKREREAITDPEQQLDLLGAAMTLAELALLNPNYFRERTPETKPAEFHDAVFVTITSAASGVPGHCYDNAAEELAARGGEILYCWSVWEGKHWYLLEHHSVVKRHGELIDITPDSDGETRRLIVPEHIIKYQGTVISGRYVAKADATPDTLAMIEVMRLARSMGLG